MSTEQRTSVDSQNPAWYHGRHHSASSQQSDGSGQPGVGSPLLPAELDTDSSIVPELAADHPLAQARRRSAASAMSPASRPPLATHPRRRSDGGGSMSSGSGSGSGSATSVVGAGSAGSHSRDRNGSSAGGQQLDVVSESAEPLHGHYGPLNTAAGQTRAGADLQLDISSPVSPPHHAPLGFSSPALRLAAPKRPHPYLELPHRMQHLHVHIQPFIIR